MNYCFNCGAKITDNQKFCIKCGSNLAKRNDKHDNYKKEYRKRFNKRPGESYNSYLERINSPMKNKIASDEEIEREREAYLNKQNRENETIYQKSEDDIIFPLSETIESDRENESPYRRETISEGMFGKPASSIEGNFVYEGVYGRPKYYIDGDIIRENNQFGRPAYRIDGKFIREGMYGKPKYYIDGDLIRENNQFGKVVAKKNRK